MKRKPDKTLLIGLFAIFSSMSLFVTISDYLNGGITFTEMLYNITVSTSVSFVLAVLYVETIKFIDTKFAPWMKNKVEPKLKEKLGLKK